MFKLAVVIDAQNDFMSPDGKMYIPGSETVAATINEYLEHVQMSNGYIGVVFTTIRHNEEKYKDTEFFKQNPSVPVHCVEGTEGFNLAVEPQRVPATTKKFILNKATFDLWEEKECTVRPFKIDGEMVSYGGDQLRDDFFDGIINSGVDEIEVLGVGSDKNLFSAIYGFLIREFTVRVYDNLVIGFEEDIYSVADRKLCSFRENGKLIIE